MAVFKVSCYSSCHSYFAPYLKSVTVIAKDADSAKAKVKQWLKDNDEEFIYPEAKWDVDKVSEKVSGVIDYDRSSDY
jgi:hypothetical protein